MGCRYFKLIIVSIIITEQEHSILDSWVDCINNKEIDALCELYSNNAVLIPAASTSVKLNPGGIREYFLTALQKDELKANLLTCSVLFENGHKIYKGNYAFTWYEEGELCNAKAQYSFVIDNNKIIVHHSSLWLGTE